MCNIVILLCVVELTNAKSNAAARREAEGHGRVGLQQVLQRSRLSAFEIQRQVHKVHHCERHKTVNRQ
jgi:hypothetical protein